MTDRHTGRAIAQVNGFLCKGCGTCAGACPNKAITLLHYDDRQIINEMIGMLETPAPTVPGILA